MRAHGIASLALALLVAGCGSDDDSATSTQTLTVLAASSLTGTFTDLAEQFEADHAGVDVKLVFDSSATLAQMAAERAPGDVLATADRRTMDEAGADGGTQGAPVQFATNSLVLVVPKDNPAEIDSIDDLDRDGVDFLTCVTSAPCGSAAEVLLERNGLTRKPISEEVDVKAVLSKVEAGEADAGLAYRTDVTASNGEVTGIDVPGAAESPNTYWVARTAESGQGTLADAWIELLSSDKGRAVLAAAGFGTD